MEEGLFYSEAALLNRALFYSDYNDVNIFVEDEGKEYIYIWRYISTNVWLSNKNKKNFTDER